MNFYYKFNFYINARHAVLINGEGSDIHPHTWEIKVLMVTKKEVYVEFSKIENILEKYLSNYEGKVLNEVKTFANLNPSMENLGKVFYNEISELLVENDFFLKSLEISENPTRTFIISD